MVLTNIKLHVKMTTPQNQSLYLTLWPECPRWYRKNSEKPRNWPQTNTHAGNGLSSFFLVIYRLVLIVFLFIKEFGGFFTQNSQALCRILRDFPKCKQYRRLEWKVWHDLVFNVWVNTIIRSICYLKDCFIFI